MKLRERIVVNASPAFIWPFIADPVLMSTWNPKIVSVDRASDQPVHPGERFDMIYKMSGKERETVVEVVACEEPVRVTFRHHFTQAGRSGFAEERYELTQRHGGTQVKQVVDLGGAGIPWLLRLLIWFIATFGTTTGETYLEKLKDTVEKGIEV